MHFILQMGCSSKVLIFDCVRAGSTSNDTSALCILQEAEAQILETGDEQDYGPLEVPLIFSWLFRRKQSSVLHLQSMLPQLLLISEGN